MRNRRKVEITSFMMMEMTTTTLASMTFNGTKLLNSKLHNNNNKINGFLPRLILH